MLNIGDYVRVGDLVGRVVSECTDSTMWVKYDDNPEYVVENLNDMIKVYRLVDLYEYYCDPNNQEDKFQQIGGELSENQIWRYDRISDNIIGDVSMKLDTMSTDYRVRTFVELIKESKIEKIRSILNTSYYEDLKLEKIKEVIDDI